MLMITKEQLESFLGDSDNFEVISELTKSVFPFKNKERRPITEYEDYLNFSIEMIISDNRKMRFVFVRQMLYYFLERKRVQTKHIAIIFDKKNGTIMNQLEIFNNYLIINATKKEKEIINQLEIKFNAFIV